MDSQSLWTHISQLRPSFRGHIHLYPQVYRDERWYVLHDQSSDVYLRFNEHAYSLLGRLEGDLTLEEILEYANETPLDYPLSQEEIVTLIAQLSAAELLKDALPLNVQDVFRQYKTQKQKKNQRLLMNPFSIKVPFLNPDRFLTKFASLGRNLFTPTAMWLWIATLAFAFVLGVTNIEEILYDVTQIEFSPIQIVIFWLIYPLIKIFHELGHGMAVKVFGGDVHEAGVNFLIFMPVAYVDASASWRFRNKWRRILVGAAGIITELFIASLALFLYLLVEPSLIKDLALNTLLIATVSTLLFNGNPLLRFDAYFILEDLLEIPNLATRSKKYYYYLIQKYILKLEKIYTPSTAYGEEKWFVIYGFLSPLYRLSILVGITVYLADAFLVIGLGLGIWIVVMQIILPLIKAVVFLTRSKLVAPKRARGVGLISVVVILLFGIANFPIATTSYIEGVVLPSQGSEVVAKTSGFVEKVFVESGEELKKNQMILRLIDRELLTKQKELIAELNELKIELHYEQRHSIVRSQMVRDDISTANSELKLVSQKISQLTIYSHINGQFVLRDERSLSDMFIRQGDVIGDIINRDDLVIRALVSQSRIGLLESFSTSAEFILAGDIKSSYKSKIIAQTPQATDYIPSQVLSVDGGGVLQTQNSNTSKKKLLTPMFQLDLSLPKTLKIDKIGTRVYIRLNHGDLTLYEQLSLYFKQLFLKHFYSK